MAERARIRCYECPNYSGGKYRGRCKELKSKVEAVDWCYRDQVRALEGSSSSHKTNSSKEA